MKTISTTRNCGQNSGSIMSSAPRRVLHLLRGDISSWRHTEAIVTSANAGLCGNETPGHWRFRAMPERAHVSAGAAGCARRLEGSVPYLNVDGRVHAACGPELAAALKSLMDARSFTYRSPVAPGSAWRGAVLPQSTNWQVGCLSGCTVHTPAFGALERAGVRTIVHAVAPDGRHLLSDGRQREQVLSLLGKTYAAAIHQADAAGCRSVAIPALGCGVNGFPAEIAAFTALAEGTAWLRAGGGGEGGGTAGVVERVYFVMSEDCNLTWEAWTQEALRRGATPADRRLRIHEDELHIVQGGE